MAANEEAERELEKDALQVTLHRSEGVFTFRHEIQFRYFVSAILYHPSDTEGEPPVLQPLVQVIADCLIEEDKDRFLKLIADSDAGVKGRIVLDKTLVALHGALIDHYRGPRPLEESELSSDSPSSTGPDSTPDSAKAVKPSKRTTPKKPPQDVNPAAVGFVAD